MGNPVVHWEFMSKDPAGVSDFYAKIFGWKVTHHQPINYRIVETGAKGAMPKRKPARKAGKARRKKS